MYTKSLGSNESHQIDALDLQDLQSNQRGTGWTMLERGGGQSRQSDSSNFIPEPYDALKPMPTNFGDFPDMGFTGGDPTIGAFLATYMDNDASWNTP
jgi:hypothetical protein